MRIAILTQALRYNYGGILQNFALQTVLRRMGHEVVTLDPHRYNFTLWQHIILILRHAFTRYIRGRRDVPILAEWINDREHDKKTRLLGTNTFKFVDKHIKRKEYWDLTKDVKEGDYNVFVVGSDQVWRLEYNRGITKLNNMFLDFTKGWKVKRIAYAASFGTDKWEGDEEMTSICRNMLKVFDVVTVRESSGIDLCKNVFNVDARHVLDPTLLLNKEDYMKLVERRSNLNTKEGDLYLYLLDENESNMKLANSMSKEMGVIPYTYTSRACDFHGVYPIEERIQPPVELWIKGFDQAKIVLTDSFHACVFSIIFRKQFYLYANKDRGMERYTSLFNILGIGDRSVRTINDIRKLSHIDYNQVSGRLNDLKSASFHILEEIHNTN